MKYVVTAKEMQQADQDTIEYFGVPQLVLMERAALACKKQIWQHWSGLKKKKGAVLIVLGTGNNAGDGAALARLLYLEGISVDIWLHPQTKKYSMALRTQLEICEKYGIRMISRGEDTSFSEYIEDEYDFIVDGIFGIGISREILGFDQERILFLNSLSGVKLSIDIPSGLHTDYGSVMGCCFHADITVTFAAIKAGMLLYPGKEFCGEIVVCDIGISFSHLRFGEPQGFTYDLDMPLSELLPVRKAHSHKGTYGKALLIAGDSESPGAAILAVQGLFRSGIGMVRLLAPASMRDLVLSVIPEVMFTDRERPVDWEKLLLWCDGVIIGPGLGTGEHQKKIIDTLATMMLQKQELLSKPMVLDADALNILSVESDIKKKYMQLSKCGMPIIVTPHMAEMKRISGFGMKELTSDRIRCIEEFCKATSFILVCKDSSTVVACQKDEDFVYYINQTGNHGMSTAGTGDVLSGILGTFFIQNPSFLGAVNAVYIHGKMGDIAASKYGKRAMKAGDLIEALIEVLKKD